MSDTFSGDVLPSTTGQNLGTSSQRWNVNGQTVDLTGNLTTTGNVTAGGTVTAGSASTITGGSVSLKGSSSGTTVVQASATASGTVTVPAATDTLVGKATTDTLTNKTIDTASNVVRINGTQVSAVTGTGSVVLATSPTITGLTTTGTNSGAETLVNKTLTSPVINGSPTGTGLPTTKLKKGTGGGNYTSASTTYVRVDATNLAYTVTIPTGWNLLVAASGAAFTATGAVTLGVALADGSADNTGIVAETSILAASVTGATPWAINWLVAGDGASHTLNLQYKTSNGSDSATMINSSATLLPTMVFLLTPSN